METCVCQGGGSKGGAIRDLMQSGPNLGLACNADAERLQDWVILCIVVWIVPHFQNCLWRGI